MKNFFKTFAHAFLGGFTSGILGYLGGAGNLKALALAAVGSAATSVVSFLSKSPAQSPKQ